MEIGSRTYPNVSASREPDKVFNPEIKEYYTPPSTGTVAGDVISSAPAGVGMPDLSGINTTVSSSGGTDTTAVPASTFTFPHLRNDLNSAPPDTEYPSFTSFGDSIPSQADVEPALEEETQQVTVQEAFDDMVVLKDGMVTSASLSYERFQATDGNLQGTQEAEDSQEDLAADAENTAPEAIVTEEATEEIVEVFPEVPAEVAGTDAPLSQVPAEGLGLDLEADVTKESTSELLETEAEVENVPITVETLETQIPVDEQPSFEEVITEQEPVARVETAEPETLLKEPPAIASELPFEEPAEQDAPSENLPEGEPPSEKPPERDPSPEMPSEVEIATEGQLKGEPPIELSEGEETQQEPAKHVYKVTEEDIQAIKGQKVLKKFGKKNYLGDVVNYDPETKWFKVVYEDGDEEDLEIVEVKPLMVASGTLNTSTKKKRPRADGDADEELNKSSKKQRKSVGESSKSAGRQKSKDGGKQLSKKQKGRHTGAKKISKSPAKTEAKSPGSKSKGAKKSGASRKQKKPTKESKSPARQEMKGKSKTRSEDVLDTPPAKSPGKSSTKKEEPKSRTRTPGSGKGASSKLTKNTEVSGASDMSTPKSKQTSTVKGEPKSSGKGKDKKGLNVKSPATEIKGEDSPRSSKVGTKRKIDVESVQVSSKRLRKGGAEKDVVPGREIDRVGEATFIGKPVRKDFDGTLFDGVVVSYDKKRKYFKVKYDDGDQEDLEWRELELILVSEGKSDVDTEAKPAKVSFLSTLMSQEKKTGRSSAKKRKST